MSIRAQVTGAPGAQRRRRSRAIALPAGPIALIAVAALSAPQGHARTPAVVARHAPLVWLHSTERLWPASASTFVARSKLLWNRRAGCRDTLVAALGTVSAGRLGAGASGHGGPYRERPTAARVRGAPEACARQAAARSTTDYTRPKLDHRDEGFYLDLARAERGGVPPRCLTVRPRCKRYAEAPVYYEYEPRRYVTYWLFYAFSAPAAGGSGGSLIGHQGDWERVAVRLDRDEDPVEVAYWQHNGDPSLENRRIIPWARLALDGGVRDGHPIVFSARSSHASYPTDCRRWIGVELCVKDRRDEGWLWTTARHLRDVERQPWYGFGGAWGRVQSAFGVSFSGPDGPGPNGLYCRKPVVPRGWLSPGRCS